MKIILLCVSLFAAPVLADIAVIVHSGNASTADQETIARLFLGKAKTFNDGATAVAIAQASGASISDEFNDKVLGKNAAQLKAYWSQLVFTGKGTPPRELANDAEVVKWVASQTTGIGYVQASAVDDSVKVIAKF